jgi:acetylornithine/N-succinyldiaminopimelate aminotransferase
VSNHFHIPGQERLAERLVAATFADQAFFCNSGAEAVECGIKMVRRYFDKTGQPERYRIVTFEGAFHGRTFATIAAGGNAKYLEGFDPPLDGFDQVPFGDLKTVERAIGPTTAAILAEPVQGEGGARAGSVEFLRGLRQLCDRNGLLLFLDEVQSGMGRTGKLFAYEWANIEPDIMAVAKAIGGGFPLGACLAREAVAAVMTAGSHGTTFGGNPLAMAVGNAVLDVMLADGFLAETHPQVVVEVRGQGFLIGLKCHGANTDLQAALRNQGLLAICAGDNVVRLLPPLIITEAEISHAVGMIDAACRTLNP